MIMSWYDKCSKVILDEKLSPVGASVFQVQESVQQNLNSGWHYEDCPRHTEEAPTDAQM